MLTKTAPTITTLEAQAAANLFLSDNLPDRFLAVRPQLAAAGDVWHVAVVLNLCHHLARWAVSAR